MVKISNRCIFVFSLVFVCHVGFGQAHLFSRVNVNKSSVFVGEPAEVSVSVYTSTWFTKGVDPGNVKVNGAFTVYFRSVSNSIRIDSKTYAGVTFIYNVFPYDDMDIVFPLLNVKVETPDEGGYKGVSHTIKTKSKKIAVKSIPPTFGKYSWMVATNVNIVDKWDRQATEVKVGDVLGRTITRTVPGSVAELIPPVQWGYAEGVSMYPSRSKLNNIRGRDLYSATRSDGVRYLFEKEGQVTLSPLVFSWWNPKLKRLQKHTLKALTINVLPNPELEMLSGLRDSLSNIPAAEGESTNGAKLEMFGLSLKQFVLALAGIAGFVFFFNKMAFVVYETANVKA